MDLPINFNNNSLNFNAKLSKLSKEHMDKILLPIIKEDCFEVSKIAEKSGFANHSILNWFKESLGISAATYYRNKQQEILKQELVELNSKGVPLKDVAEKYGRKIRWVKRMYMKFGLKLKIDAVNTILDNEIFKLLNEGYTEEKIAEKMNCSVTKIKRWLDNHIENGIVKYRHKKNISLIHEENKLELAQVELIKQCFDAKLGIKETAKTVGIDKARVSRLKAKYGLKTESDLAHEKMEKFAPQMVKDKLTISQMAEFTGLSPATVSRWISKTYGKNYIDIRMNR